MSIPSLSALLDLRVPVVELEAPFLCTNVCIEKEIQKLWMFSLEVCVCVCDKNCCIDESCPTPSDRRSYDAQLLSLSLENVKHCANKSRLSVSMLRCLILGAGFEDLRWWHFFRFRKCWGFASVFFKFDHFQFKDLRISKWPTDVSAMRSWLYTAVQKLQQPGAKELGLCKVPS